MSKGEREELFGDVFDHESGYLFEYERTSTVPATTSESNLQAQVQRQTFGSGILPAASSNVTSDPWWLPPAQHGTLRSLSVDHGQETHDTDVFSGLPEILKPYDRLHYDMEPDWNFECRTSFEMPDESYHHSPSLSDGQQAFDLLDHADYAASPNYSSDSSYVMVQQPTSVFPSSQLCRLSATSGLMLHPGSPGPSDLVSM